MLELYIIIVNNFPDNPAMLPKTVYANNLPKEKNVSVTIASRHVRSRATIYGNIIKPQYVIHGPHDSDIPKINWSKKMFVTTLKVLYKIFGD